MASGSTSTHGSLRRPWSRWHRDAEPLPRLEVRARDGLRLVVHHAKGEGEPVVLLHGLGSNITGFHFPERSLALWLRARGHDVYLPELRGHGASERPRDGWTLDDYLERDLPAVLEAVLARTGRESLRFVGHSMGGILLFAYGILHPTAPIARGISVASALDYRPGRSVFGELLPLRPFAEALRAIPYGAMAHWLSPLYARVPFGPSGATNVWPENAAPEDIRRLYALGFHAIPTSLLRALAGLFEPSGLVVQGGAERLKDLTPRYRIPTLPLGGSRDAQVSTLAIEETARRLPTAALPRFFGRAHGHATDYGHFDLLMGTHAPTEVWPVIDSWLARGSVPPEAPDERAVKG